MIFLVDAVGKSTPAVPIAESHESGCQFPRFEPVESDRRSAGC
jgi:hypothetical protein